jgi:hypothetical protein
MIIVSVLLITNLCLYQKNYSSIEIMSIHSLGWNQGYSRARQQALKAKITEDDTTCLVIFTWENAVDGKRPDSIEVHNILFN